MELSIFLESLMRSNDDYTEPLVCFYGVEHSPQLFFTYFLRYIHKTRGALVQSLDITTSALGAYKLQLSTTFLGRKGVYWLGDLTILPEKSRQQWIDWLVHYRGPHTVMFFSGRESFGMRGSGVVVPATVDKQVYVLISQLMQNGGSTLAATPYPMPKVPQVTLDQAILCMWYAIALGRADSSEYHKVIESVIAPEVSLFALSKHFLEKAERPFFKVLSSLHGRYSVQFWVAFWSEQVWRAHFYVQCMVEENYLEAKAIGQRLPFAFVQKSWRVANRAELRAAHSFLHDFDHFSKNGASEFFLELLYLNFFSGNFLC